MISSDGAAEPGSVLKWILKFFGFAGVDYLQRVYFEFYHVFWSILSNYVEYNNSDHRRTITVFSLTLRLVLLEFILCPNGFLAFASLMS